MEAPPSLLILGAGQYGRVAREVALAQGGFSRIDFLDDAASQAVGKLEDVATMDYDCAFVAIGNPQIREQWVERIRQAGKPTLATLIHPSATTMPSASIGEGSIIEAGAVLCSNCRIGTACIIMANAVVGHDATVEDFCQIKYNAVVPERSVVLPHTQLACNERYVDKAAMEARNRRFLKAEAARTGAEPSFF